MTLKDRWSRSGTVEGARLTFIDRHRSHAASVTTDWVSLLHHFNASLPFVLLLDPAAALSCTDDQLLQDASLLPMIVVCVLDSFLPFIGL